MLCELCVERKIAHAELAEDAEKKSTFGSPPPFANFFTYLYNPIRSKTKLTASFENSHSNISEIELMKLRPGTLFTLILAIALLLGCNAAEKLTSSNSAGTNAETTKGASPSPAEPSEDGTIASGTGTEKEKPTAGKANVQGKAFFNEKPAAGVEV